MATPETHSPAMNGQRDGATVPLAVGAETRGVFGGLAPSRTRSPDFLRSVVGECRAIERACRLRALHGLVGGVVRPKPATLLCALRKAETDDRALTDAQSLLDALPSSTVRRLLSAWIVAL